jgi:hypothetical protein
VRRSEGKKVGNRLPVTGYWIKKLGSRRSAFFLEDWEAGRLESEASEMPVHSSLFIV